MRCYCKSLLSLPGTSEKVEEPVVDCFFCSVQIPPPEEAGCCLCSKALFWATVLLLPVKEVYSVATAISPATHTPSITATGCLNQVGLTGAGNNVCCRAIKCVLISVCAGLSINAYRCTIVLIR